MYSKAIDEETPIWTPNGWRRAGDIRAGDKLHGSTGKWTAVIYTSYSAPLAANFSWQTREIVMEPDSLHAPVR